jgi:hypothetical protein
MRRPRLAPILVVAGSVGLGFILTAGGMATWDSLPHLERSQWLLHELGLPSSRTSDGLTEIFKWYGPLWTLLLGVMSELVLGFLRDGLWVQHALNFALFPAGLYALHRLLVRAGVAPSTSRLAVALVFGCVRLGGHALVNVNDFPMAMLSLLVPLYLWNKLREIDPAARAARRVPRGTLVLLGVVAMAPFLVRPPVLVEPVVFWCLLAFYAVMVLRGASLPRRFEVVALPLLAGVAFGVAIWPSLWERARALPLKTAIFGFTQFAWSGDVRAFGHAWPAKELPRWYALIWLPVVLTPPAALVAVVGLVRCFRRLPRVSHPFSLQLRRGPVDLSLRRWLAVHAALFWLGVVILHPTLYDEDRHLLFLFPPVLVLAALAFDACRPRVKDAVAVLLAVTSLASYAQWGRYAYVYKSPVIGDRSAARFMGDYWAVCVPLAISALQDRVPANAEIVVPGPYDAAVAQYRRLREGRFSARPGFGPYRLVRAASGPGAYSIVYNRNDFNAPALRDVAEGRAKLIWQTMMPPGDPACVIVLSPPAGGP